MSDGLQHLGEFGLIDRFRAYVQGGQGVLQGIGDDCAVLAFGDRIVLASIDAFVEDVHFSRKFSSPEAVGHKAAMAALSDIAAMGGMARFVLVTLAIPPQTETPWLEEVYRGIGKAAEACGATVVGGDTTGNPAGLVIDVTVLGEPVEGRYLLRSGAKAGDLLAVTGRPGASAAGLHALQAGLAAPDLIHAHLWPTARIREGQWLAARPEVCAMIDLSDGLLQDAGHIAAASQCGLSIDTTQIAPPDALMSFAEDSGLSPVEWALQSGEEYELVVALDREKGREIAREFETQFGLPLQIIGQFTDDADTIRVDGEITSLKGYDHFASDA